MKNVWTTSIFLLLVMVSVYGNNIAFKTISVKCTDNLNQFCLYGYTNDYMDIDKVKADFAAYENTKAFSPFISAVFGMLKEKTDDITKQKDHLEAIMKQKRAQYQLYKTTILDN